MLAKIVHLLVHLFVRQEEPPTKIIHVIPVGMLARSYGMTTKEVLTAMDTWHVTSSGSPFVAMPWKEATDRLNAQVEAWHAQMFGSLN